MSHSTSPYLLVLFNYLLLARENPGFFTAAPQGQVLQRDGLHILHLHSRSLLHPANILKVVPGVGEAGSWSGVSHCPSLPKHLSV